MFATLYLMFLAGSTESQRST